MPGITFDRLLDNRQRTPSFRPARTCLLCLDPGETTGVAVFHASKLHACCQSNTSHPDLALNEFTRLFDLYTPTACVIEDYRVYGNRAQYHIGSSLHTPRMIGIIEALCLQRGIPYHKQMAGLAKGFVTDAKLRDWGWYAQAERHSRDAIRHGAYFILFPPKTMLSEGIQRSDGTKHGGHHVG